MSQRTYPRRESEHAEKALDVLARHAQATDEPVTFPVPIEMIVEKTFDLRILWDEIPEREGQLILGALSPRERTIVLNLLHEQMFARWIGPERFTLAHELAHWIYDADDPSQLVLDLPSSDRQQFCYHRESLGLSEFQRIREVNANKLAAHLLMPEPLVRAENIAEVLADLSGTAEKWQVSRRALTIRLQELGLADGGGYKPTPVLIVVVAQARNFLIVCDCARTQS